VAERTKAAGARLVLDETLTGFRVARGGAAEAFGISPDVAVFGGVLGGGVAQLAALAWQRDLAATPGDELAPPPSPIAVLAATATLSVLRNDAVHQRLEERGAQLQTGVETLAERFQRHLRCSRLGSVFSLAFARQGVVDGNSFARVDQESWARFLRHTRDGGVLLPTRASSVAFLSHAHGVKDVELIISTMEAALRRMQKEDEA